jgi:FHA domain-containing protein
LGEVRLLRISVYQFKGAPPDAPLVCEFREQGGTIGRDASNQLALPDQERHMSRVQAEVQYANGAYRLLDHGSNATTVNGMPVGKGNTSPLRDGDEIGIAFYTLRVEIPRAAPSFVSSPAPASRPQPQSAPPAAADPLGLFEPAASAPASPLFDAPAAPSPQADPFAPRAEPTAPAGGLPKTVSRGPAASAASDDPFAVFGSPPAAAPAPTRSPTPAPLDDPFAAFGAAPAPAPVASPLGIDLPGDPLGMAMPQESSSLDSLFNLDNKSSSHDPFAGSALGADPLFGGSAPVTGAEDPLALLSGGGTVAPPTERDDAPLMREAYVPPKVVNEETHEAPVKEEPAVQPVTVAPTQPAKPHGGVVSWENNEAAEPAAQPPVESLFSPAATPAPRAKVVVDGMDKTSSGMTAARAAPPAAPAQSADATALLEALVRGLGVTGLKPKDGLTPELMEHVGRMLREAAHGTIELLLARAVTKREVRAEMTMIVSKNNNPLKFSPDVNFALMQLIAPQGPGFMAPVDAMRDAYDDLRAHQIGFMAGMRGALTGVLGRFKPEDLEARLSDKSFLDSVLPGGRKAKLWDLYEQRFAEISREAEDNFHAFFGREFLKAYEEQLDRLHDDRA